MHCTVYTVYSVHCSTAVSLVYSDCTDLLSKKKWK